MDNGLTEYVLWLKLPSTEETFYLFFVFVFFTSRKGLVIRREEKAGKMVWLREENAAGEWLVWYSQEEPCWRLGETGLSCADSVLITLSQVMIWCLEIKIKFEKSVVRPLWMSEGLLYMSETKIHNLMLLPVVAQCHIAVTPLILTQMSGWAAASIRVKYVWHDSVKK